MEHFRHSGEGLAYLKLLSEQFPTPQSLYTEIINLNAILNLPKGTEHFISDIHGEYEAFCHILNNCSGVIREKAEALFGDEMDGEELGELMTLIYYPGEKLSRLHEQGRVSGEWYLLTLRRLISLSRVLSSKYTRSKVRKAMPPEYAYILDELLHAQPDEDDNQLVYHRKILETLIAINSGDEFIEALGRLIKRLAVDRLHIVGDIYDRGPRSDSVMELLLTHHAVDIEWGNHDMLWMGAACGNPACMAAVVRGSLAYGNTEVLETGYGISLRSLTVFAQSEYPSMPPMDGALQAISVIMFKLEGQLIARHPEYGMEGRRLLHKIRNGQETLTMNGRVWKLKNALLPTVGEPDPYALTDGEKEVMRGLESAFMQSQRLHRHVSFLYRKGHLFRCCNGNLLFHGCVPMTPGGTLARVELSGAVYSGRSLMEHHEAMARAAYFQRLPSAIDFMWYLWCAEKSPLCGRGVKTFERMFIDDPEAWHEPMNPYYEHMARAECCVALLREFGLTSPESHIINGHTPVHAMEGESPVKGGGRLIVIDGGFCRPYQKKTGIAGYTLIANSHGLRIAAHQPFTSLGDALDENRDIHSDSRIFHVNKSRAMVGDTDDGMEIQKRIDTLGELLEAYRSGAIAPKES